MGWRALVAQRQEDATVFAWHECARLASLVCNLALFASRSAKGLFCFACERVATYCNPTVILPGCRVIDAVTLCCRERSRLTPGGAAVSGSGWALALAAAGSVTKRRCGGGCDAARAVGGRAGARAGVPGSSVSSQSGSPRADMRRAPASIGHSPTSHSPRMVRHERSCARWWPTWRASPTLMRMTERCWT